MNGLSPEIERTIDRYLPVTFEGFTFYPVTVEEYELFMACAPALGFMQQSLPVAMLSTPLLTAFLRIESVFCSQIDYNRHLNNAFYAMFTENWLGRQLDAPARFREIQINFNQSTAIDETLICTGTLHDDGRFCVSGTQQNSGKNAFIAHGICDRVNSVD